MAAGVVAAAGFGVIGAVAGVGSPHVPVGPVAVVVAAATVAGFAVGEVMIATAVGAAIVVGAVMVANAAEPAVVVVGVAVVGFAAAAIIVAAVGAARAAVGIGVAKAGVAAGAAVAVIVGVVVRKDAEADEGWGSCVGYSLFFYPLILKLSNIRISSRKAGRYERCHHWSP